MTTTAKSNKPRLAPRSGWWPIPRHDAELIRERTTTPTVFAVWVAMLDLANVSPKADNAERAFTANIALIANKALVGYRVALAAVHSLETWGLISVKRHLDETARNPSGPSTFKMLSVGYAINADPVCKRSTSSIADKDEELTSLSKKNGEGDLNRVATPSAPLREEKKKHSKPRAWGEV